MKKTMKKSVSKASRRKAVRNLDVKPTKGGSVRGGETSLSKLVSVGNASAGAGSGRTAVGE